MANTVMAAAPSARAPSLLPPGAPGRLEFSLRGRGRAALFLLAVFVPGVWLMALTARAGLAGTWGESWEPRVLERAVALEGGNAQLHFNLGTAYLWAEGGNPTAAVRELRAATRLTPSAALYWSALAKGCYAAGDGECSRQAWERAARLSPANPRMAWEAALHYTVSRQPQAAWPHFRRLLRLAPGQATRVFDLLLDAGDAPESIWRELAHAADGDVRLAFLNSLVSHAQFPAAERFWGELAAAPGELPLTATLGYVEDLLRRGHYRAASQVWSHLQHTGVVQGAGGTSLVFNGGFEQTPLPQGLDWHLRPQQYLAADFASPAAHSGERALRLEFTVPENAEYEPAYQFVPVQPGESYTLSAWVRSENITSDSGPRLRVEDPQCPACLSLASAGTVGTQDWQQVELQFAAPAAAEMVRLSLWRPRSRSFPMEISGRFWLDDVRLQPSVAGAGWP
jgi:tetratricopeptide (TPR) repeat protein